jgi:hypothetical protein
VFQGQAFDQRIALTIGSWLTTKTFLPRLPGSVSRTPQTRAPEPALNFGIEQGQAEQQGDKKRGLSGILTEESFAIRPILLGQERPSKEASENSRFNSPVPTGCVNETGL